MLVSIDRSFKSSEKVVYVYMDSEDEREVSFKRTGAVEEQQPKRLIAFAVQRVESITHARGANDSSSTSSSLLPKAPSSQSQKYPPSSPVGSLFVRLEVKPDDFPPRSRRESYTHQ